jgi:replicative superfamily II helicase
MHLTTGALSTLPLQLATLTRLNLILTTPEKWDALGRKYRHNDALINNIGLVLLDETVSITPIAECSLSKY